MKILHAMAGDSVGGRWVFFVDAVEAVRRAFTRTGVSGQNDRLQVTRDELQTTVFCFDKLDAHSLGIEIEYLTNALLLRFGDRVGEFLPLGTCAVEFSKVVGVDVDTGGGIDLLSQL